MNERMEIDLCDLNAISADRFEKAILDYLNVRIRFLSFGVESFKKMLGNELDYISVYDGIHARIAELRGFFTFLLSSGAVSQEVYVRYFMWLDKLQEAVVNCFLNRDWS